MDGSINEQLIRKQSKELMQKLYDEVKKQGGDIADKVSKTEKTKQDKMSNAYYINNPFDGKRKIDTYEDFCLKESRGSGNSLEDMYTNKDGHGIEEGDYRWLKGDDEDKLRPFFNNHSTDTSLDLLRVGKQVKFDKKVGNILKIKNGIIYIDVEGEIGHEIEEFELNKFIKKIKKDDKEL